MARRLSISASGVKFSPAGVDCLAATNAQLLFNSEGNPYNGCFATATIPHGDPGWSTTVAAITNGTRTTRTFTVPFGRTFPTPPRVFYGVLDPDQSYAAFTPHYTEGTTGTNSTSGLPTGSSVGIDASVSTTSVTFTVTILNFAGAPNPSYLVDVAYIIFLV